MRMSSHLVVLALLVLFFDAHAVEDHCGSSVDAECKQGQDKVSEPREDEQPLHLLQTKAHLQRAKSKPEHEEDVSLLKQGPDDEPRDDSDGDDDSGDDDG